MPKSQAAQRRDIVATDELGRPWLVATEMKTGDPTGHLYPCRGEVEWKGYSDEDIPPQQYLRVPKNKWGQAQPDRIEIDFERWRDDVSKANDAATVVSPDRPEGLQECVQPGSPPHGRVSARPDGSQAVAQRGGDRQNDRGPQGETEQAPRRGVRSRPWLVKSHSQG